MDVKYEELIHLELHDMLSNRIMNLLVNRSEGLIKDIGMVLDNDINEWDVVDFMVT